MERLLHRLAIAALALPLFILPAIAAERSPQALVEAFHVVLLDTMKRADSLGIRGRYTNLERPIESSFDLRLMVAIASGRYWRKANRARRDRLARAFTRFSVGTYAANFSSFSGESFETIGVAAGPRGTRLVNTRLNRTGDSPIAITYVMKKSAESWRIVDVIVDSGISQLAVRRSEFATPLKRGGIEALTAVINEKADGLVGAR